MASVESDIVVYIDAIRRLSVFCCIYQLEMHLAVIWWIYKELKGWM